MPTVTRENLSLLNDKITVTVNKEDYLPSFEKTLKQYAKQANIPGFRKGMVPAGMIRKMHGPAVFTDEVLRTVEKSLMDYLRQEQLDIFAQPLPADENDARGINMQQPDNYSFSFEIGLKPAFQVADLATAKVTRYDVQVTDDMVEEELQRLRKKFGKLEEPGTVDSEENVLNLAFEAADADGNVAEGATPKENSLLVKYFAEPMRKKLMGAKKGDQFTIRLADAFEEKEREWVIGDLGLDKADPASADKTYRITIAKLGLVQPRELDEAFFKEVFPTKDIKAEAEFREEIRNEIKQYWEGQSRNLLQHELYHVLLEQTQMDFPESFLRRWMMTGGEAPKTAEQVEAEFPTFRNQLRWTLVSDRIVQEQGLNVGRDEIRDEMRKQVMGYFGSMSLDGNFDWLDSYIDRMLQDEQQVESTYRRVITEKIFQWAETQVHPSVEQISTEAFLKLQEKHNH
jgi:trigger factor